MVMKATTPSPNKKKKPLLLKDFLLDDMSSCSSGGFRSYPRHQGSTTTTTVRLLLEIDMIKKKNRAMCNKKRLILMNNNEYYNNDNTVSLLAPLQKLSGAVISTAKRLSFDAVIKSLRAPSWRSNMKKIEALLPRSLSRKVFWKKKNDDHHHHDHDELNDSLNCDCLMLSGGKCAISTSDGDVSRRRGVGVTTPVGDDCDVTTTTTSMSNASSYTSTTNNNSKKSLTNEGEKDQCSPVCVLDCPLSDEEDEVSSPFRHGQCGVERTEEKPMKKIFNRFDHFRYSHLEPLNLENKLGSPEEDQDEKPLELLELIKAKMPLLSSSSKANADNLLLLDFFKEGISSTCGVERLLSAAEDWVNGKNREFSVEWDVQKNREAFVEDMEKRSSGDQWKTLEEEKKKVVYELEAEVFASLLYELLDHPLLMI